MAVLWITQEGKLFEKNGLDEEVLYLESALVQRALIAGSITYGEMTGSLMAAPKLQGADLVMVAGFLNQLLYRLVVRTPPSKDSERCCWNSPTTFPRDRSGYIDGLYR